MCSGRPAPGAILFTVPIALQDLAASGWRYELHQLMTREGNAPGGSAAFSWRATTAPGTPDPLAAAQGQVRAWLATHDWEPDPVNPARYHG